MRPVRLPIPYGTRSRVTVIASAKCRWSFGLWESPIACGHSTLLARMPILLSPLLVTERQRSAKCRGGRSEFTEGCERVVSEPGVVSAVALRPSGVALLEGENPEFGCDMRGGCRDAAIG